MTRPWTFLALISLASATCAVAQTPPPNGLIRALLQVRISENPHARMQRNRLAAYRCKTSSRFHAT